MMTCDEAGTVMRERSKAKFLALILIRSPLSSVGDGVVTPVEVVEVVVIVTVVASVTGVGDGEGVAWVSVVPVVPGVTVVTGVGTVVPVTGGWLVQPATSTAIQNMQSSRVIVCVFIV